MIQSSPDLPLRDIHAAVAPPWWPPAPGWWWVAAGCVLAMAGVWLWWRMRTRRRRAIARLFDQALHAADTPAARLAAMSELLRRASRRHDRHADTLHGEAWLVFLEQGMEGAPFSAGPGRILVDGPYRPEIAATQVEALHRLARKRFLTWMGAA